MKKFLADLLSVFLPVSAPQISSSWESDPVESKVGIHVLSNFAQDIYVFSEGVTEKNVRDALQSVDWIGGFHQIVVVTSPGISMEVGGSLNPDDGLSAVYRDRTRGIEAVTKEGPEDIAALQAILLAFLKPGDDWQQVQEFSF